MKYARGEAARSKIIETAIVAFGQLGFQEATTRLIAKRAKVNLGALQYYFGGKEGLYLACAEHIAAYAEGNLLNLSAMVEATLPPPGASEEEHVEALCKLWSMAADRIVGAGSATAWMMFISREQMSPGKAFDILYERVVKRLVGVFSLHVGRAIGKPADSEEAILRTIAVLGPLFLLQRAPSVALRALHWPDLKGARLDRAKAVLLRQMLNGLNTPVR